MQYNLDRYRIGYPNQLNEQNCQTSNKQTWTCVLTLDGENLAGIAVVWDAYTPKMSDQDNGQVFTLQRPTNDDPQAWKAYWKAQGWPWRTEPEIDADRQKYLTERSAIVPDIEKGMYPFRTKHL